MRRWSPLLAAQHACGEAVGRVGDLGLDEVGDAEANPKGPEPQRALLLKDQERLQFWSLPNSWQLKELLLWLPSF